jgi:beclin
MAFVCQQCKEPLQLDASLDDLAPSAYDTIVSALPPSKRARTPSDATKWALLRADDKVKAIYHNAVLNKPNNPLSPRAQSKQPQKAPSPLPTESFVLLQDSVLHSPPASPASPTRSTKPKAKPKPVSSKSPASPNLPSPAPPPGPDSDPPNPSPLSHHLRSSARLFDLLSSRTDIDHPLCAECTQILLNTLNRQLEETKKERDGYIAFDKELRKEREKGAKGLSKEEAEQLITQLQHQEAVAIHELKEAEKERHQLDEELRALELEEKALELEEAEYGTLRFLNKNINWLCRFWRVYNEQSRKIDHQELQIASLRAAHAADSATLDKLERTNVYNDAFCIGHDGVFGTINGLRLGRVPGVPVRLSLIWSS